jgi:hypothetical protein
MKVPHHHEKLAENRFLSERVHTCFLVFFDIKIVLVGTPHLGSVGPAILESFLGREGAKPFHG